MSSDHNDVRQIKKKRKANAFDNHKRGKDTGKGLPNSLQNIVFPKATAIISEYLESLRSFQITTFQEWFDKFTTDDFTFFMMRLQENAVSPISVYKEVAGKESACNFTYIRMMSVPDGVISLKLKGIYPSFTDPDALCMIVCDCSCTATRVFETEAIEDQDDPGTEEGESIDQQQYDLELAVASLHKMARFKEQNQMPLDDGVFDDSSLSSCQPLHTIMSRDEERFGNDNFTPGKESKGSMDDTFSSSCHRDIIIEINEKVEHRDVNDDISPEEDDACSYDTLTSSHSPATLANTDTVNDNNSYTHNSANTNTHLSAGSSLSTSVATPKLIMSSTTVPIENNLSSTTSPSLLPTYTSISYPALSSTNRSYTSTEPGVFPLENHASIIKTVFKQKQVRLVDRMPIFIAKPGAMFRLGERLPNGGTTFELNSKMEFYVNKEEKVYKMRHLMHA